MFRIKTGRTLWVRRINGGSAVVVFQRRTNIERLEAYWSATRRLLSYMRLWDFNLWIDAWKWWPLNLEYQLHLLYKKIPDYSRPIRIPWVKILNRKLNWNKKREWYSFRRRARLLSWIRFYLALAKDIVVRACESGMWKNSNVKRSLAITFTCVGETLSFLS